MVYEVRVEPVGLHPRQWYVFAPAFGVGRFVADEAKIPAEAHAMIAACGAAARKFDIRVVQ